MKKEAHFAFIVHSRNRKDLVRKFPLLRFLPQKLYDLLTLNLPPFVVSNITGLRDGQGNEINGILVGIPMTAHQLVEKRILASKKIVDAVKMSKKRGVRYVGLGAMTGSLSKGGREVIEKVTDVTVTTGRTYTVKNIVDYILYCCDLFKLDRSKIKIAIVGAAGGIGSGTAVALANKEFKNFILIDLERKLRNLKKHIETIQIRSPDVSVSLSHKLELSDCQFIVCATSAPEVVIRSEDVSSGTIIINDAQPSDVAPDIAKFRKDVIVIEAGVVRTDDINCNFNMGLAHKNDIYSCLAETLLLTYQDENQHYSVDGADFELLDLLELNSKKLGFAISPLQNDEGYLSENHLKEFAKIVEQKSAL